MDKLVAHYTGTVEAVSQSDRRPNEDVVRFRTITDKGVPSQYYEVFGARHGTIVPGDYAVTVLVKAIPYTNSKTGKAASFLSCWVLSATPLPA